MVHWRCGDVGVRCDRKLVLMEVTRDVTVFLSQQIVTHNRQCTL